MTHKDNFIKALRREKVQGKVPHFELVFFLTMEAFGKVHPTHRNYAQWNQMSKKEQGLHIDDLAHVYVDTAVRYDHSAIFVHSALSEYESTAPLLERIRQLSGDEYFIMLHGDPTFSIPEGNTMMDFTQKLFEEPDLLKSQAARRVEDFASCSNQYKGSGLIDGFALCADYCLNTNPFFGPDLFDEFIGPYLTSIIAAYRESGYYTIKHTDGNIMPILDRLVACHPDALHSLDPQGGVDLKVVRDSVGDQVCLIGNVNCGLLQTGTEEECIADIRRSLTDGMKSPGYIFSTSNCIYTGLPLERYELMQEVWNKYGIY
ncbi:MAG: uroporphyrinogen decarboxylase family protein [Saccharofermentanales bacterium]